MSIFFMCIKIVIINMHPCEQEHVKNMKDALKADVFNVRSI